MLAWVFLQHKDYRNAYRQAQALDRRLNEGGQRLITPGQIALVDKDYAAAIMAFDFIVEEKGQG